MHLQNVPSLNCYRWNWWYVCLSVTCLSYEFSCETTEARARKLDGCNLLQRVTDYAKFQVDFFLSTVILDATMSEVYGKNCVQFDRILQPYQLWMLPHGHIYRSMRTRVYVYAQWMRTHAHTYFPGSPIWVSRKLKWEHSATVMQIRELNHKDLHKRTRINLNEILQACLRHFYISLCFSRQLR